jgi:hypothetical protein
VRLNLFTEAAEQEAEDCGGQLGDTWSTEDGDYRDDDQQRHRDEEMGG